MPIRIEFVYGIIVKMRHNTFLRFEKTIHLLLGYKKQWYEEGTDQKRIIVLLYMS